jgi:hypothetical protein
MFEYFNYDKRCIIYQKGKYALTKIFENYGADSQINPNIKTKIIDEATYSKEIKEDFS